MKLFAKNSNLCDHDTSTSRTDDFAVATGVIAYRRCRLKSRKCGVATASSRDFFTCICIDAYRTAKDSIACIGHCREQGRGGSRSMYHVNNEGFFCEIDIKTVLKGGELIVAFLPRDAL